MRYILVLILAIIGFTANCVDYKKYDFTHHKYTYSIWVPENMQFYWRYNRDFDEHILLWQEEPGSDFVVASLYIRPELDNYGFDRPKDSITHTGYKRVYDNNLVYICGIAENQRVDVFDSIFNSITVSRSNDSNRVSLYSKYRENYTTTRIKFQVINDSTISE